MKVQSFIKEVLKELKMFYKRLRTKSKHGMTEINKSKKNSGKDCHMQKIIRNKLKIINLHRKKTYKKLKIKKLHSCKIKFPPMILDRGLKIGR